MSKTNEEKRPSPPPSTEEQLEALKKEKQELYERLLRTAAEFENWKKRTRKEQKAAAARGRAELVRELLPVLDNLDRALRHAPKNDPIVAGIQMVQKQLLSSLEKFGITRFDPTGQRFDPALHEAVEHMETAGLPAGVVARALGHGYLLEGRLLRPALVAVAKPPSQQPAPDQA